MILADSILQTASIARFVSVAVTPTDYTVPAPPVQGEARRAAPAARLLGTSWVACYRAPFLGGAFSVAKSDASKIGRSSHSPSPSTSRKRLVHSIASSIDFTWNSA